MKQIPASLLTLVAGALITIISWWAANNHGLLPEQVSIQAPLVDQLFDTMFGIGTALFIAVEGAIIAAVVIFRKRDGEEGDGDSTEGNVPLEIFWTFIPAVIVIGLGVYSVDVYREMGGFGPVEESTMVAMAEAPDNADFEQSGTMPRAQLVMDGDLGSDEGSPSVRANLKASGIGVTREGHEFRPAQMEVNVSGMQYAWLFEYPGTDIVAGELHIPVNTDVQLNLSAVDVIHSFWVPQFRLKQDAIPGHATTLRFVATKKGTYPIVCAELCGAYHGGMRAEIVVDSPEDYATWLTENQFAANPDSQIAQIPPQGSFVQSHLKEMGAERVHSHDHMMMH